MSDRKVKTRIKQSGELPTGEYPNAEGGLVQHKVNERRVLAKTVINKMVEVGESEYSAVLKTRKLLIFRDARNAGHGKIAANCERI
jgi:hypothetical protein